MTTTQSTQMKSVISVVAYPLSSYIFILLLAPMVKASSGYFVQAVLGLTLLACFFVVPAAISGVIAPKKPGIHAFFGAILQYTLIFLVFVPMLQHYILTNSIGTNIDFTQRNLTVVRILAFVLLSIVSGMIGFTSSWLKHKFSNK